VKSYRKAWEITKTKGVTKGMGKATVLSPRLLEYYLLHDPRDVAGLFFS